MTDISALIINIILQNASSINSRVLRATYPMCPKSKIVTIYRRHIKRQKNKRRTRNAHARLFETADAMHSVRISSRLLAWVTLPEYAFINPVGSLAIGLLQANGRSGAAVQTLTSVPKVVLLPFLGTLVTLALPSDVSQSSTEMPYHLLYAMMMMVLSLVFVGRTRWRRRRRRFTAARCPMMMLMVIMMRRMMMAVTVNRVVQELMLIGRVGAAGRAVGRGTVRIRGTDRAAG